MTETTETPPTEHAVGDAAAPPATVLPEVEVSASRPADHSPTSVFRYIGGVLHQMFEGPPGSVPKAVPVPGTSTPPGLLADVEKMIDSKLEALGPAANALRGELETFKASVVGDIQNRLSPMIAQGVSQWVNSFETRLKALEAQVNTPAPAPSPSPPPIDQPGSR
jgi:hypothetical protein